MNFTKCLLISLLIINLLWVCSAQSDNIAEQINEAADNLEKNVTAIREFTETDKWNFIGSQWKEFLLKNKLISSFDSFFTEINIVFLVLFGMSWSLSLNMFFAFLFWIVTFLSINKYMNSMDKAGIGLLYSLIAVVLLAQINLFEYFGKWVDALVFMSSAFWIRFLLFLAIISIIICWLYLNKYFAELVEKKKKKKLEKEDANAKKTFTRMIDAAVEGGSR